MFTACGNEFANIFDVNSIPLFGQHPCFKNLNNSELCAQDQQIYAQFYIGGLVSRDTYASE